MKKNVGIKILVVALALSMIGGVLASCSNKGKTLMKLGKHEISANLYELFMCRYKATLAYSGYDVNSNGFWNTVINKDTQATFDDYFASKIVENCKNYLAVLYLFDEEGLKLSDVAMDKIDKKLKDLVELDGDGSKSSFNALLADYGVNYDILREAYILEAKYNAVLEHFYGKDASQISDEIKNDYLKENYYTFKQCFLPYYYYVYETDENGDVVYYNSKTNQYLYDTEKGKIKYVDGKPVKDKFGNDVYVDENGKTAYDTKNGKKVEIDKNGDGKCDTAYYDTDKKKDILKQAEGLKKQAIDMKMTQSLFEAMIDEYSSADNVFQYLKTEGAYSQKYVADISANLKKMGIEEIAMVESDYGCHIIMKCSPEENAFKNDKNKGFFTDFNSELMKSLLIKRCDRYYDMIEIDEKVLKNVPNFKEVNPDYYY